MSAWVPGTYEGDFIEPRIIEVSDGDSHIREQLYALGSRGVKFFQADVCNIIVAREPAGANGEMLWHLTISCHDRHPTWDEIKFARYKLLPVDRCFGMLLPQPEFYVNVEMQDHVFHLWEITDPREPWTAG
jgi:hypothetical protein